MGQAQRHENKEILLPKDTYAGWWSKLKEIEIPKADTKIENARKICAYYANKNGKGVVASVGKIYYFKS